jgi:hypothetical protein
MIRESDEECLALIAAIKDRVGDEDFPRLAHSEVARLLGNLEARIKEAAEWVGERSALWAALDRLNFEQPLGDRPRSQADLDADAEEDRQRNAIKAHWRDVIREEVRKEVESQGAAKAVAQPLEDVVAAEVARQLAEQHEPLASPAIRTWVDNVQHELDKLRTALEAKAS